MRISPRQGRLLGKAAILCGVVLSGVSAIVTVRRVLPPPEARPATAQMTLDELGQQFVVDERAAERRWSGQIIDLTGPIESYYIDGATGAVNLGGSPSLPNIAVHCDFSERMVVQLADLKDGQQVTIRGEFIVRRGAFIPDSAREMANCSIVASTSDASDASATAQTGERK